MPEKYTVKITQQAQEQIREIISYIRFTLQAPETAMKMLDTLQEEIASLDQFPNRVPLTEEEPWHSQGIHKFPVKNYLVYFWVDEKTKKVQIIGAVYGRKDQRHQLSNLDSGCALCRPIPDCSSSHEWGDTCCSQQQWKWLSGFSFRL